MSGCYLCTKPHKMILGKARFCYQHGQEFLIEMLKTLEDELNTTSDHKRRYDLLHMYIPPVKNTLKEIQQYIQSER